MTWLNFYRNGKGQYLMLLRVHNVLGLPLSSGVLDFSGLVYSVQRIPAKMWQKVKCSSNIELRAANKMKFSISNFASSEPGNVSTVILFVLV